MSAVQRLAGCLSHSLGLCSRQWAVSSQPAAAFHLSATLEGRRRQGPPSSRDDDSSDSDEEEAGLHPRRPIAVDETLDSSSAASSDTSVAEAHKLYEKVKTGAGYFDVQTLVSPALAAMLQQVPEREDERAKQDAEMEELLEKIEKGGEISAGSASATPEELANDDQLRLLAEAIDLYFEAAPDTNEEADGLGDDDRTMLAAMGETLKDVLHGGSRVTTVNTAPPGRLPWEVLSVEEEKPLINWAVDLTEGRAQDPWKNAQLSDDAKQTMHAMHKEGWSVEQLAEHFQIRQQRVMAILALKDMEEETEREGGVISREFGELMEERMECQEAVGSGERHHVVLPSFPNYRELTEADAERLAAFLEGKLGKPFEQIEPEDMTPELTEELLAAAGMDKGALEEDLARREEQHLVAEFRQALEYNLGKTGTSLRRESRKKHPAPRPDSGWSLLVQPLGRAARDGERQPYVALPDGTQRELSEDEKLHLARQQPRPRRKIV